MTCGCAGTETSQLLMNGGAKKRVRSTKRKTTSTKRKTTSTKRKTTSTKRKTTSTKRKSTSTKRKTTVGKRRSTMRGGGEEVLSNEFLTGTKIPLRVQSSPDWVSDSSKNPPPPYAIDLGEAMQSYLFGRPTPNGKEFMIASGLVEKSKGVIDMVGGAKRKKRTTVTKKRTTKKRTSTKKGRSTRK
jgi:hypothetical protein